MLPLNRALYKKIWTEATGGTYVMALIFGYISRYAVFLPRFGAIIPVSQKADECPQQKRNSGNILTLYGVQLPSLFLSASIFLCLFAFEVVIL